VTLGYRMPFSPLAIPPGTLTLLHVCTLEREAAFWFDNVIKFVNDETPNIY
jgi:hypothetical protein